jgi:outer membrane murein-binding lipoprotein Lpp
VIGSGKPPSPVVVPRAPFVALVLLLVAAGVLGILLLNTKINENAFELTELREQQTALDQREQQLEEEIAQADSTAQLAAAARRLGLEDRSEDLVHLRLPEPRPASREADR